ncbi:hypothetical protein [Saccharothrix sp.]|uniref:hypothetical protein n=1 Tax=Saccharothrix sp. TaxID=1873460 RepID=UPI002811AC75|nr:hypothetical protein [Saccharothrix sp.]
MSATPALEKGVAQALSRTTDLHWVGAAPDGRSAVEFCQSVQPDVVLVDSVVDVKWDLCLLLTSMFRDLDVVALLRRRSLNPVSAAWARLHGAKGVLGVDAKPHDLLTAIRATVSVGHYVHPALVAASPSAPPPTPAAPSPTPFLR